MAYFDRRPSAKRVPSKFFSELGHTKALVHAKKVVFSRLKKHFITDMSPVMNDSSDFLGVEGAFHDHWSFSLEQVARRTQTLESKNNAKQ